MNVNDFITGFNEANDKEKYIRKHIKTYYVNYEDKITEAEKIIRMSNEKEINNEKVFMINSATRYLLFILAVIKLYTDIEIDNTNAMLQFNILEKYGVIDLLPSVIGIDYERFSTVLGMIHDDYMVNNRELVSYLENKSKVFVEVINDLYDAIEKQKAEE